MEVPRETPNQFLLTRPSRGATPYLIRQAFSIRPFLLTRPSRGATSLNCFVKQLNISFLLTRPSRGATFSPPAPSQRSSRFYSHAPRGARHDLPPSFLTSVTFLLTRPSRGATTSTTGLSSSLYVSTHTPLAGRDELRTCDGSLVHEFLLTRPSRGATMIDVSIMTTRLNE